MNTTATNAISDLFRVITRTTLRLIVFLFLDAKAEEKLMSDTSTKKTSAVVSTDHTKSSQVTNLEHSVVQGHNVILKALTQKVSGSVVVTELEYDHCHFNESHQHHHCYESEEHTHEETSTYTRYRTSRPTRRYEPFSDRHRSYRHSTSEHSSHRYSKHSSRDSWNPITLGLAIGLPLAYSQNHLDRGRYQRRYRGHRNDGYYSRGYFDRGYFNRGCFDRGRDRRIHHCTGYPHGSDNRRGRH